MADIFIGAAVFDGFRFLPEPRLRVDSGLIVDDGPGHEITLAGGILAPGFLDLQVNGGGGRMVDGTTDVAALAALCDLHARQGATGVLPTLITDSEDSTRSVLKTAIEAARQNVPGFLGLHLEGPHLDPSRKGAHDDAFIRPMSDADMAMLLEAAAALPSLMVTLAPEAATHDQINRLADAGVIVSLGHSNCSCADAMQAIQAGARAVTHLFNAMSQLGSREPGLVGAALQGKVHCGIIADGWHVAPETLRIALAANSHRLFLVTDSMAIAGTDLDRFDLQGRTVRRQDGRLVLGDGTLAGADLTLPRAVALVHSLGLPIETALAMATSHPAACLGRDDRLGHLQPGAPADIVHLDNSLQLAGVWRRGQRLL